MNLVTLKKCPFCRSSPRHLAAKAGFYTERVICDVCGFHLTATMQLTAVQNWNRRAAVEVTDDMVAAAARVYHPSNFGNKNNLVSISDDEASTKHMIHLMLHAALSES